MRFLSRRLALFKVSNCLNTIPEKKHAYHSNFGVKGNEKLTIPFPLVLAASGNLAVLEKAKENLQNLYAFVGLTEEMKTSFAVLKRILPDFFAAGDIPMDICNKCKSNDTGKSSPSDKLPPRPPPGEKNLQALRQLNSLDIELYDFAVKLFWEKAAACGVALKTPGFP